MSRLPCGRCDIGIYDPAPILNGLSAFRDMPSKKAALAASPRCKCEPDKICAGAVDWLAGATFPMTKDDCAEIERLVSA